MDRIPDAGCSCRYQTGNPPELHPHFDIGTVVDHSTNTNNIAQLPQSKVLF